MKLPKWLGFLPDRNVSSDMVTSGCVQTDLPPQQITWSFVNYPSKPIHEVIIEARTSQGITQVFIAKKIGISVHYLRKIESGDNDPSLKVVKQLATALNTPLTFTITPE